MDDVWIILVGALVACTCSLLGCFLILRKMAMVGDAISHSVLPGIVIAYLLAGKREPLLILIGAALVGVFTTVLIELLHKKARIQGDASIGVIFTWLFSIGVILITLYAGQVDIDQDCVLYGNLTFIPLDLWDVLGIPIPRAVVILAGTFTLIVLYILWGFKGLKITTFNPDFAAVVGISIAFWHYSLMSMVSLTTVISFESVGAILVVGFLVIPPATAYLLTEKLKTMLLLSCSMGILSAIIGHFWSVWMDGAPAAAMVSTAGIIFILVFVFRPKHGLLYQISYFRRA